MGELDVCGWHQKIHFSLALSEFVLDVVKVKILLISWYFQGFFWLRPPPDHLLTPPCFDVLMVFR